MTLHIGGPLPSSPADFCSASPTSCSAPASTRARCGTPSTRCASSSAARSGWGRSISTPTSALELPAPRGRRTVALSAQDALQLVDALPEAERALWAVALFCGLRRGELRALRCTDVDLAGLPATIAVTRTWDDDEGEVSTKSEAGERTVALPSLVAAHLLATSGDGDDLVFGATASRPFTPVDDPPARAEGVG